MASRIPTTPEDLIASDEPFDDLLLDLLKRVDRYRLAELSGLSLSKIDSLFNPTEKINADVRKLDIVLPGGMALNNINTNTDVANAVQIMKALNLSPESFATLLTSSGPEGQRTVIPVRVQEAIAPIQQQAGTTIQEMVPRYATRKQNDLSEKTQYENGNYHRKFVEWLEIRKRTKHIPVHAITRADIADYIDDLLAGGLGARTIANKYLPAISGLFDLAQKIGVLPAGQLVSRGHGVYSKSKAKKDGVVNRYKTFSDHDLQSIFQSTLLQDADRPADFWLPLLGLFTGGRISELCQLDVADIQKHGEIWAISINGEGDKNLKTIAAIRLIPIHQTLLDCGFLDYVSDAKQHGTKLFPYLTPDAFGSWGGTPSDRWGNYLDKLGIKDPKKVFHSFRSTSNNVLRQSNVSEENRCQFIGHEHDTVNSKIYADPAKLPLLMQEVATKLIYPSVDFSTLVYQPGQYSSMLTQLCAKKARTQSHKLAKARLAKGKPTK